MPLPVTSSEGRVIIITGANRGIGFAAAKELLARGARVAAGVRTPADMPALGPDLFVHELNVADASSSESFVKAVTDHFGRIDGLVNNAGILIDHTASVLSLQESDLRRVIDVNLIGPFRMCQLVLPPMLAKGYGRIVNITSGLGSLHDMGGGYPSYRITKVALNGLTRTLAGDLGRDSNIKVNSLCPGWVRTDMGGAGAPRDPSEPAREIADLVSLGPSGPSGGVFRHGQPIEW